MHKNLNWKGLNSNRYFKKWSTINLFCRFYFTLTVFCFWNCPKIYL